MPRLKRIIFPGLPHHLTQRGNRGADVFRASEDQRIYIDLLNWHLEKYRIPLFGYCLMRNHIHLICTPCDKEALPKLMHDLHGAYALYYNRRYRLNGHLWQGRFYSCVLEEEHFWAAIRYVERNPVRAKVVGKAEAYPWSSASARCGIQENAWLAPLSLPIENKTWCDWLREEDDDGDRLLRMHTQTGRPYGSDSFLDSLEKQSGWIIRPRKAGRMKKQTEIR